MTDGSSNGTMTDNAVILEKLSEILRRYVEPDPETGDPIVITEETDIFEDLGADSLDLFELVMALEEKYEVEIPSEELAELTTVGAVMEYLKNKGVEA